MQYWSRPGFGQTGTQHFLLASLALKGEMRCHALLKLRVTEKSNQARNSWRISRSRCLSNGLVRYPSQPAALARASSPGMT